MADFDVFQGRSPPILRRNHTPNKRSQAVPVESSAVGSASSRHPVLVNLRLPFGAILAVLTVLQPIVLASRRSGYVTCAFLCVAAAELNQVENYNKKYRFFTSVVVILAVREVVLLVAESPSLVVVQFVVALSHTLFMEVPSCVPGFRMQPPLLCAQRIVLGAVLASCCMGHHATLLFRVLNRQHGATVYTLGWVLGCALTVFALCGMDAFRSTLRSVLRTPVVRLRHILLAFDVVMVSVLSNTTCTLADACRITAWYNFYAACWLLVVSFLMKTVGAISVALHVESPASPDSHTQSPISSSSSGSSESPPTSHNQPSKSCCRYVRTCFALPSRTLRWFRALVWGWSVWLLRLVAVYLAAAVVVLLVYDISTSYMTPSQFGSMSLAYLTFDAVGLVVLYAVVRWAQPRVATSTCALIPLSVVSRHVQPASPTLAVCALAVFVLSCLVLMAACAPMLSVCVVVVLLTLNHVL